MSAGVSCTCLVCHGMDDTKQCIGECHTCQALCVVHTCSRFFVAIVRFNQIGMNHLDCVKCQRIGVITMKCGYIRLDRMGHRIHTGVCGQLLRHGLSQLWIHDRYIWCDIEIC